MKTGCFTICSRNYLAYALTLRESLAAQEPDLTFRIYLADAPLEGPAPAGVEIIPVSDVLGDALQEMAFRYNVVEFNTAVKPFCFDHMFDSAGCDAVIYLDPDIQLFAPLDEVHDALSEGSSCVLTPHICSPLRDTGTPSDIDLMRSGTFNLGFAAFANTPEARNFIRWWGEKLTRYCRVDLENGLFVDQRFVDFAPSLIRHLTILRHPGYNVAYWNLANRPMHEGESGLLARGHPLVFFHFSGVVPSAPDTFSKHQSRFNMENIGIVADLVRAYIAQLNAHDHLKWSALPYAYGAFETGEKIIDPMRQGPPANPEAPFAAPNHAYWNAPSERVDQMRGTPISRLMYAIHAARPDLREAFPLSTANGRRGFHAWFLAHGPEEYRVTAPQLSAALPDSAVQTQALARTFARLRLGASRLRQRPPRDQASE